MFYFKGEESAEKSKEKSAMFHLKVSQSFYNHLDLKVEIDELQPLITNFTMNCSRDQLVIKHLIQSNEKFRKQVEDSKAREMLEQPNFLQKLVAQSLRKSVNGKRLLRYDDFMKDVGLYLFMIAGPLAYETLQKNLPIPSRTTIHRQLGKEVSVVEGALQVHEIKEELVKLGLPLYVWFAEDDTRLQKRKRYNIASDSVMGLQLPLDDNGMPRLNSFPFTTISAVKEYIQKYPEASYAKLVTCKALHPDSKTFIVLLYGTSGTDQAAGVSKRWEHMHKAFADVGITVMGKQSQILSFDHR